MKKVLVTTVPFGTIDSQPLDLLAGQKGLETVINPIGRRLTSPELGDLIGDVSILIAGTEPIERSSLERAAKLKIICRVGIGLDNVDLECAAERGIKVTYTPDAPAPAVAELAIGQMLNLCRFLARTDQDMRQGIWKRRMGRRLATSTIGVIGAGRIGSRVLRHLSGFAPNQVLVNDIVSIDQLCSETGATFASKDRIFAEADIISLHVPLDASTRDLVSMPQFEQMKSSAILINTARGGIVNEADLLIALQNETIAAAAMDVFEQEPYEGPLRFQDNCILSSHIGSCTTDCRFAMELEAVEDALRHVRGETLHNEVPMECCPP